MDEKKLMDMFIQERINMLLLKLEKTKPEMSPEAEDRLMQAELFINDLPTKEKDLIENYVKHYLHLLFLEEAFLYRNGFLDGVKVTNLLGKL
ncbi:hypothetical protein LJC58_10055 [Lachnospiraceae bacterium OttesenSCG-928-D06]|nr:hypothetical protein [Lachnospiraceae bacterium OttesenSCG-928-D06]